METYKHLKTFPFYGALAFVLAVVSLKFFLYDNCFFYDANDDSNHTFVNLYNSFFALKNFTFPLINIFNNFGTPIIGDALSYPFSIGIFSYFFVDPVNAITVNRIICFILVYLLSNKLFSQHFSNLTSAVLSVLVVFYPGIFWNIAHHHYQFTIPFYLLILILISNFKLNNWTQNLLLYLVFIFYFLSVSIQLIIFSIPFIITYTCIVNKDTLKKILFIFIAALLTIFPHIFLFFFNMSNSARTDLALYSGIINGGRELFLSFIFPFSEWSKFGVNGHFSINTYFSFTCILLFICGLYMWRSFKVNVKYKFFFLGLIPTISAFIIQFMLTDFKLFRSIDSLRLLWFSYPFLIMPIGIFLDHIDEFKIQAKNSLVYSLFFIILLCTPLFFEEISGVSNYHLLVIFLSSGLLLLLSTQNFVFLKKSFTVILITLSIIPVIYSVLGLSFKDCVTGNHFYNPLERSNVSTVKLVDKIPEMSRATFSEYTVRGNDFKLIYHNIFGAYSRAIVTNKKLKKILFKNDLITLDADYFFSYPLNSIAFAKLGISYFFAKSELNAIELDWIHHGKESGYSLYQNKIDTGVVHSQITLDDFDPIPFKVIPNGIALKNANFSNIRFTNFNSLFWKAYEDNDDLEIFEDEFGMMVVYPKKLNSNIKFIYGDKLNYLFYTCLLLGLLFFIFGTRRWKIIKNH